MRYADICAGISAATLAWKPLGWRAAFHAENDKFPSAVLAHHYPETPNLGDITQFESWPDADIDVLVGGTPCQGFSIAGLRKGLDDPRSNLALCFGLVARRYKPRWLLWENVPGARSQNGGRDLGAFLRGLAELGYGLAWRSLDAQFAGLAQRRERLFVVGYLGDWRAAAAVLFEPEGLRWDPAPSREAGKGVTASVIKGAAIGRSPGAGPQRGDSLTDGTCFTLQTNEVHAVAFGGNNTAGQIDLATACNAHGGPHGRLDFDSETFITHSLRGESFDASEDGTGRGTPIVPMAFTKRGDGTVGHDITPSYDTGGGGGIGNGMAIAFAASDYESGAFEECDSARPLTTSADRSRAAPVGAFAQNQREEDHGADASAMGHDGSHANAGGQVAVAIRRPDGQLDDGALARAEDLPAGAMRKVRKGEGRSASQERGLAGQQAGEPRETLSQLSHEGTPPEEALYHLRDTAEGARLLQQASLADETLGRSIRSEDQPKHSSWAVRRLTPRECERLQGFPDDFTAIPWRGKPAEQCPDGPRYKALGNSIAVPCLEWIGRRIELCESAIAELRRAAA